MKRIKPNYRFFWFNSIFMLLLSIMPLMGLIQGHQIGWVFLIIFWVIIIRYLLHLLPESTYLEINQEGVTVALAYKKTNLAWATINSFKKVVKREKTIYPGIKIGYFLKPEYRKNNRFIRLANSDYDGFIPDVFEIKSDKLANILNEYLLKYRDSES